MIEQGAKNLAERRRLGLGRQSGQIGAGRAHEVLRQVAAVKVMQVLLAILEMVEHLKRRAERIGGCVGVARFAVDVEDVAADRHGGDAAVVEQLVPGRVAALGGVLTEGDEQVCGVAGIDAGFGEAHAKAGSAWRAAVALPEQHRLHMVEARDLVGRLQVGAVADVVGIAGEGVVGVDVAAEVRADDDADGKVLVAAILAGPAFDVGDFGSGGASAHD